MRSHSIPSVAALILALTLAYAPAPVAAVTHTISPWNLLMSPLEIDAVVGDTLHWPNTIGHNVFFDPSLTDQDLDVVADGLLICASIAQAVQIDLGGVATAALTTEGTFYYYCGVLFPSHCSAAMRIRVNVSDPTSIDDDLSNGSWGRIRAAYR